MLTKWINTATYDAFDRVADGTQVAESVRLKHGVVVGITGDRRQLIWVDGCPNPDRYYPDSSFSGGGRLGQSGS